MGFGSDSGSGEIREINDINITPFVDVVLVLLVIFMVTAPMMMKDLLKLQLPQSTTSDGQSMGTLSIVINNQNQFILNGEVVDILKISESAKAAADKDSKTQVIISGDRESKHGSLVQVIDAVKSAGLANFAIQVEKSENADSKK